MLCTSLFKLIFFWQKIKGFITTANFCFRLYYLKAKQKKLNNETQKTVYQTTGERRKISENMQQGCTNSKLNHGSFLWKIQNLKL